MIRMGKYLASKHEPPEIMISSTASRAFYTALFLCDQYKIDESRIELNKELFHAGSRQILDVIKSAKSSDRLAVFGHNPGFTDCANLLANTSIDNVPTCGVVGITFQIAKWEEIEFGKGSLDFFYYPKGI